MAELKLFKADFEKHGGLLPKPTVPGLLGVSRQRFDQMCKDYTFWSAEYFESTWFSRKQIEEFHLKRIKKGGRPAQDRAAVIKAAFSEFK